MDKKTLKAGIILALMIAIFVGSIFYDTYEFHFMNEERGIHFNESSISGFLTSCSANREGTFFTVNDSLDFWVLPKRKSDDSFQMLCRDSEKGDFIEKKSFGNELILIRNNGDTIRYTFVKYLGNGEKIHSSIFKWNLKLIAFYTFPTSSSSSS